MGRTQKTRSLWVGWKVKELWSQGTSFWYPVPLCELELVMQYCESLLTLLKNEGTSYSHLWEMSEFIDEKLAETTVNIHQKLATWGEKWCGCFQMQMFVFWWLTSPALMSSKHKGWIFWTIPKWSMTLFQERVGGLAESQKRQLIKALERISLASSWPSSRGDKELLCDGCRSPQFASLRMELRNLPLVSLLEQSSVVKKQSN